MIVIPISTTNIIYSAPDFERLHAHLKIEKTSTLAKIVYVVIFKKTNDFYSVAPAGIFRGDQGPLGAGLYVENRVGFKSFHKKSMEKLPF